VPVKDKATGGIYWWNEKTDETTAVGDPNPDEQQYVGPYNLDGQSNPPQTLGQSMMSYLGLGFGISMAFAVVGKVIGG
jgi:hypothetical protein